MAAATPTARTPRTIELGAPEDVGVCRGCRLADLPLWRHEGKLRCANCCVRGTVAGDAVTFGVGRA